MKHLREFTILSGRRQSASFRQPILVARAEALFTSSAPIGTPLNPIQLEAVVASSIRTNGGLQGCVAEMASAFGDRPQSAVHRMRWALHTVDAAYGRTA